MNSFGADNRMSGKLPIYGSSESSEFRRAAVIDVGSNSVRLVVFDGAARSPAYFYNEKVMCGLGSDLARTGKLDREGKERALETIKRFMLVAREMEVSGLLGVATAAVRDASDGESFCHLLNREAGLDLLVATGEQEAILAGQGVLLGWPQADGIVSDLGGASMELARIKNRSVTNCMTSQIGALLIGKRFNSSDEMRCYVDTEVREMHARLPLQDKEIFLVGGSWRAIARLDMERRSYPLRVLNDYELSSQSALQTVAWLLHDDCQQAAARIGVSRERFRLLPNAGIVLQALIDSFQPRKFVVSAHGIREGIIFEQMPQHLQLCDPLIEACKHAERATARLPGYGDYLYDFILPLFRSQSSESLRLIHAACLLHDVSWRAHPDYRAIACFENATRANLCGLDHAGRVFLAVALYHRYKSPGDSRRVQDLQSILSSEKIQLAFQVGKAMRFGAMLTVVSPEGLGRLKFKPRKLVLSLQIPRGFKTIWGGIAEERFDAVANAMNCKGELQLI